jgi:hypothetical protein
MFVPRHFSPDALETTFQFGRFPGPEFLGDAPAQTVVIGPIKFGSQLELLMPKTYYRRSHELFFIHLTFAQHLRNVAGDFPRDSDLLH